MTIFINNGSADGVVGTVRLNVGFDNNALTGNAGSFVNFTNQSTAGSLDISGGTISTAGAAGGTAQVSGTIDFQAGLRTINETFVHSFSGTDGEYNIGAPQSSGNYAAAWTVERQ